MTNFEMLMSCETPEQFMSRYEYFDGGCRQHGKKANEVYRTICLSDDFRGMYGCTKCKLQFWKSEYESEVE